MRHSKWKVLLSIWWLCFLMGVIGHQLYKYGRLGDVLVVVACMGAIIATIAALFTLLDEYTEMA